MAPSYFMRNEPRWAFGAHNLAAEMLEVHPGTDTRKALAHFADLEGTIFVKTLASQDYARHDQEIRIINEAIVAREPGGIKETAVRRQCCKLRRGSQ